MGSRNSSGPAGSSPAGRRLFFGGVTLIGVLTLLELGAFAAIIIVNPFMTEEIRTTHDIYREQSERIERALVRAGERAERFLYDRELGWRYRPGYRDDHEGINHQGLRSRHDYTPVAGKGVVRIAAFGDSFVFGNEVGDDEAWPSLLEGDRTVFEVLNYGVGAYGTDQALLRYVEEGGDLSPEIVLIGFAPIDLRRCVNVYRRFIHNRGTVATKPRFLQRNDGSLVLLPNPVPGLDEWRSFLDDPGRISKLGRHDHWYRPSVYENPLFDHSAFVRLATIAALRIHERYFRSDRLHRGNVFNTNSEAFQLQVALIERFAEEVRRRGARPLVLLLPDLEAVSSLKEGDPASYHPLSDALRERGLEVMDGLQSFGEVDQRSDVAGWFVVEGHGHYSAEGNRKIAAWLCEELVERISLDRLPRCPAGPT